MMRIIWQTVRRIANEILGVKGLIHNNLKYWSKKVEDIAYSNTQNWINEHYNCRVMIGSTFKAFVPLYQG